MSTSAALKVARGREANIEALETAYTDGPGERDDQAKYDLATDELVKEPRVAYTVAWLTKKKIELIKQ